MHTIEKLKNILTGLTNTSWVSDKTILINEELKLFNKSLRLAIEYCDLSNHTEHSPQPRDKNYHNNKRLECEKQGIRLITIFEDEWLTKQKQVINYLRSVINSNSITIFARKTKFKIINKQEAKTFLEEHHIQGYARIQSNTFGLFYNNELISVMTFGPHHRDASIKNVLNRFAVKDGYNIPGGASKLFKNACKILSNGLILSWSDNRWSQGNVYEKLGFILTSELKPDYSYFDSVSQNKKNRRSKQSQQKKKTNCPEGMTEKEWTFERGLWRIWDCGKKRWEFTNTLHEENTNTLF